MRAPLLAFAVTVALYACSASSADPIPDPDNGAPDLDAGGSVKAKDSGTNVNPPTPPPPPSDGGSDATSDAEAGAGDPVNDVRINEIYVNQNGGVATAFVEVRGAAGTPVDDLQIRILHANGTVQAEYALGAAGAKIRQNGTWSIGGGLTPGSGTADTLLTGADLSGWGFDTPRGAIQLVRGPSRTLIDVVGYDSDGDAGAGVPAPASAPTQTVEGKPAVLSTSGKSFGRKAGAADTNDNRSDFCQMTPSLSAPNGVCN